MPKAGYDLFQQGIKTGLWEGVLCVQFNNHFQAHCESTLGRHSPSSRYSFLGQLYPGHCRLQRMDSHLRNVDIRWCLTARQ